MNGCALIVESQPLYREALARLLVSSLGDVDVVTAGSVEEGLDRAGACADMRVVLLDLDILVDHAPATIGAFRDRAPTAAIVVMSVRAHRGETQTLLRAGASAVVSKGATIDALVDAVYRACREAARTRELPRRDPRARPEPVLTPRQQDVLALLVQGHPNKKIGSQLGLAEITVKMHVSSIFRALGVSNRTQAAIAASRLGLILGTDGDQIVAETG